MPNSAPITPVSWGANRLDIFAIGTNNHMFHKAWYGQWTPGWEDLEGVFVIR